MSPRLYKYTKWLWCLLALNAGSLWGQTRSVTVKTPPSDPSTIEAQAKFFQDFFSVQLSPYKIEFGHVCEDPNTWEQRYEKKDFKNHRDMGKVRWGDKKGGYGEHYWDLNHAGHAGNHGDNGGYDGDHSDGSYHQSSDPYDDSNINSHSYDNEDYEPERGNYEESGRAKRAYPKVKVEKKHHRQTETFEEASKPEKQKRKNKDELEADASQHDVEYADDDEEEDEEPYEKPKLSKKRQQLKTQEENQRQSNQQTKEKNQVVLVVTQKDDAEKQKQEQPQYNTRQPDFSQYLPQKQQEPPQYLPPRQAELPQYVPYEGGAGVRQHQQPDVSAATTVPRLFLEPSTGHVIDRATGQAYVLQPIAVPKKYN